jgi:hypothetical protein
VRRDANAKASMTVTKNTLILGGVARRNGGMPARRGRTKGAVTLMKRSTYRMVRDAGYSRWQAFRAAVFDIDPPDPWEKTIAKAYASLPNPDQNKAELDASRARLWKSGDERIKQIILSDFVEELDKLVGDPAAQFAYLDKIRRIDPELAERVMARHMAEMNDHLARHGLD